MLAGGNSVKIIEKDHDRCLAFSNRLPGAVVICGDGAEQELLIEEGIESTDAFVSLTGMDEENILISCFAAAQNVPTVITKVNRPELASMAQKLGLDIIISPKKSTGDIITGYAELLKIRWEVQSRPYINLWTVRLKPWNFRYRKILNI